MPRIPVYNSRVPAPGPIPGLGTDLAAPGRALTRLGGAIVGFGEALSHRAAGQTAAARLRQIASETDRRQPRDESVDVPGSDLPDGREDARSPAVDDVRAVLDRAHDEARFAVMRADALSEASLDGDSDRWVARALAYFDAAARRLIEQADDPALRDRRQALARDHREVLVERLEQRRTGRMAATLNGKLSRALGAYANAARRDPAMLPAMLKQGADTIAESARLAGLGAGQVAALTKSWVRQAHIALVEGTIARDPALALASLESGELDAPLGEDAALIGRLTRQAGNAVAIAEAADRQRARTQRALFDLRKTAHLERIRSSGRGDPGTAAMAEALLDSEALAAFDDEVADAEAQHLARRAYGFMTTEEIAADIEDEAPDRGPQGTDESARDRAARMAARDAVLAERSQDPAAWAMGDETVAQAFAAAETAQVAASPDPEVADAGRADRAFQQALALRLRVQADMGETPRLLSEAEREALAVELQSLPPAERLARIGDLRRRYGDAFGGLVRDLSTSIAPDTGILLAHAGDPLLAGALARGMEKDAVAFEGARVLPLPLVGGRLDKSRLEDRQLYRLMAGGRIVRVVYDGAADALVPAVNDAGSIRRLSSAEADPDVDAPGTGRVAPVSAVVGEGSVGLPDEEPAPEQDPSQIVSGGDIVEQARKGSALTQAVILTDEELSEFSKNNETGVRARRNDDEIFFSLGEADEFLSLPPDAAGYAVRNWDSYRSKFELLSKVQDVGIPPEALRRLVEDEVYKGIPEHLRDRFGGPGWISMEGGDPDEFGQRAAAAKLKAFDDLVAALDADAPEETVTSLFETFQRALLPELLGWGPVLADIVKDLIPGLGNVRSGIHAWNDLIQIANDFNDGDLVGLLGNSGMLVLDALGVIPVVGSAFAPVRIAVKSGGRQALRAAVRTPAGRIVKRWRARYRLAEYLRTTTDTLKSRSIEEYFSKVWKDLPPRMQDVLRRRFAFFVGRSGELKTMSEAADAGFDVVPYFRQTRFDVTAAKTGRKTRVYDFLTEQDFRKVWNDWFVVPGKSESGLSTGIEVKVNLSKYLTHQKDADTHLTKVPAVAATEVMRIPGDMIKPAHLAAAIEEWLNQPWRKHLGFIGGVRRRELEDLVKELQKPGDLTVGQLFGLTLVYALGRYGEPDESGDGLMLQPSAMP